MATLTVQERHGARDYANISSFHRGVGVLARLFPAIWVLKRRGDMGHRSGCGGVVDGQETFPGVPIAVGAFSIVFNIVNLIIRSPSVHLRKYLLRAGTAGSYREFDPALSNINWWPTSNAALLRAQEAARHLHAVPGFLDIARNKPGRPRPREHGWQPTR